MLIYAVKALEDVAIEPGSPIAGMDLMSPFVWQERADLRIMLRAVPVPLSAPLPSGVIASGSSVDGLTFRMDEELAIVPGTQVGDPDAGGCEDPTVLPLSDNEYMVFYTGVDAAHDQGCMMLAQGASLDALAKRQVVIKAPPGEGNIKEATLVQTPAGDWRMFYEYAQNDASRIGLAASDNVEGPWSALPDPFGIREDGWDNWHLSTGPIVCLPGLDPVMFYNGATVDARWRIGWVTFSADFSCVTDRGIEPLIVPPPDVDRAAADIAFAASAIVEDETITLYYSLDDKTLHRASIVCASV